MIFNTLDDYTWLELVRLLQENGFTLVEVETTSYSANSVVQDNRTFGLKNDLVVHLRKANGNDKQIIVVDPKEEQAIVAELIMSTTDGDSHYKHIDVLNYVIAELFRMNKICKLSTIGNASVRHNVSADDDLAVYQETAGCRVSFLILSRSPPR